MIRRAFTLDLHEENHAFEILAVPRLEGFQSLRFGIYVYLHGRWIARCLICFFSGVEPARWQLIGERIAEHEFVTVGTYTQHKVLKLEKIVELKRTEISRTSMSL